MFVATIHFRFPPEAAENALDAVQSLLAAWYKNGQVYREWLIAADEGGATVTAPLPEEAALDARNANRWVSIAQDGLKRAGITGPVIQSLARDMEAPPSCTCAHRTSPVLYTTFLNGASPVRCGDCFLPVPLYHLLPTSGEEFWDLVNWAADFEACDTLQMGGPAEPWAEAELASAESGLSKSGRELADRVAEVTGLPTYYFLLQAEGVDLETELSRRCPVCGSSWHVEPAWHSLFDFRCDTCHLLSNVAYSFRH